MGGQALHSYGVSRMDDATYKRLSEKALNAVNTALKSFNSINEARLVPSWREKSEHGDIDIVVPKDAFSGSHEKLLKELCKALDVQKIDHKINNNMVSFVLHDGETCHQVDLICVKDCSLDFAYSFYSWNDVSTILLRVARRMGVRISPDDLSLSLKEGTNKIGTIFLTNDYKEALEFLGLNYERWAQGFNNLEEIYQFFSGWMGFNYRVFDLKALKPSDRKNVEKRPGYIHFLKWIEAHPELEKKVFWKDYVKSYKESIWEKFPHAKIEHDKIYEDIKRKKETQEKFNGHIVNRMTGLEGKELGNLMKRFKMDFNSEKAFQDYVMNSSEEEVKERVLKLYEEFKSL